MGFEQTVNLTTGANIYPINIYDFREDLKFSSLEKLRITQHIFSVSFIHISITSQTIVCQFYHLLLGKKFP